MKKTIAPIVFAMMLLCTVISCGDKDNDNSSDKITINGVEYDIKTLEYDILSSDGTPDRYMFILETPQTMQISLSMFEDGLGQKIDMMNNGNYDWVFNCTVDMLQNGMGANSWTPDELGSGSWMKAEKAGKNFNLSFDVRNTDGTLTVKADLKGKFKLVQE